MKVLIVGGGIAGCTCAALLRKYNSDIVFDKSGKLLKVVPVEDFEVLGPPIIIKRADLHQGLFELLHDVGIRFNTTCTKIKQKDKAVHVEFSDNTQEAFDLVIGADGTNSVVRKLVFGENFKHYYGWRVWMCWLPSGLKQANNLTSYYGNGKICAVLPFFDNSVATLFAKTPPGSKKEENQNLKNLFKNFCDGAQDIVDTVSSSKQMYYDDVSYVKMPLWYKGSVVLIGDAQHAVSPITGMGASMAMEDALVLVEEIRSNKNIQESLSHFVKRREKRIRHFRKMVDRMDKWTMADGILGYLRNKIIPIVSTQYFVNTMRRFVDAEI